jgi:hypothetical protein
VSLSPLHPHYTPAYSTDTGTREYYCADISWSVSFNVSAWERVYATDCRGNIRRLAAGKQLARAQYLPITAILLAQRLTSDWGNIVSLRMIINPRLANLASDHYASEIHQPKSTVPAVPRFYGNMPALSSGYEWIWSLCPPPPTTLQHNIITQEATVWLIILVGFRGIEECRRMSVGAWKGCLEIYLRVRHVLSRQSYGKKVTCSTRFPVWRFCFPWYVGDNIQQVCNYYTGTSPAIWYWRILGDVLDIRRHTYLLTYGAEPFLRSCRLRSPSRTPQHFMEPEGSIPCSQEPYPEPYQSNPLHPILSL